MVGNPVDPLVCLQQPIGKVGHAEVPRVDSSVDYRRVGPPAVWIIMVVGFVADHVALSLQVFYDVWIGVEDVLSSKFGDGRRIVAFVVDGNDQANSLFYTNSLIFFAKAGSQMNDPGPVPGLDKICPQYLERIGVVLEVRK